MRVALTGAATGIGAALAARLKRDRHQITAFDIAEPAQHADRWIRTDLGDPASIDAAIAATGGRFDALINNAGLPPRRGTAEQVLNVNFLGLRRFVNGMLDQLAPGASIVNTASRAARLWRENIDEVRALMALQTPSELGAFVARRGIDHIRAYDLSKEALIVMTIAETKPLLARGLRMNCVSPAAVSTGILDDFVTAFGARATSAIARTGRPGTAEEVADAIAFLAGPDSRWLKGAELVVDGGTAAMHQADALGLRGPGAG